MSVRHCAWQPASCAHSWLHPRWHHLKLEPWTSSTSCMILSQVDELFMHGAAPSSCPSRLARRHQLSLAGSLGCTLPEHGLLNAASGMSLASKRLPACHPPHAVHVLVYQAHLGQLQRDLPFRLCQSARFPAKCLSGSVMSSCGSVHLQQGSTRQIRGHVLGLAAPRCCSKGPPVTAKRMFSVQCCLIVASLHLIDGGSKVTKQQGCFIQSLQ